MELTTFIPTPDYSDFFKFRGASKSGKTVLFIHELKHSTSGTNISVRVHKRGARRRCGSNAAIQRSQSNELQSRYRLWRFFQFALLPFGKTSERGHSPRNNHGARRKENAQDSMPKGVFDHSLLCAHQCVCCTGLCKYLFAFTKISVCVGVTRNVSPFTRANLGRFTEGVSTTTQRRHGS